jgi:hypothetical protein
MIMTFEYPEGTVPCTRCGFRAVPRPDSIDIDPICAFCSRALHAADSTPPEFLDDDDSVEDLDKGACPGYGEYCGNLLTPDADLCPDCHGARLDRESPRIPR